MYRYIIIDDESLIRKGIIKKLSPLENLQCVGQAGEGREGISLIEKTNPDFALVDMQMPGMDGMELLPYLAKNFPRLPFLVISGYRDFDYIKQAMSSNATEYLLKPFSREDLQKCVEDIIDKIEKQKSISKEISQSQSERDRAHLEYDLQTLRNLILGYHNGAVRLSCKKLKALEQSHCFNLLTLHFSSTPDTEQIQTWICEHGFGDLTLYLPCNEEEHPGFLILFTPLHQAISEQNLVKDMLLAMEGYLRDLKISLLAGVSQRHASLQDLSKAFTESSKALDSRRLDDAHNFIYFYKETEDTLIIPDWKLTDTFLFRIEAGMTQEVAHLFDNLFDSFYPCIPNIRLSDIKYHCYLLSKECREILNRYLSLTPVSDVDSMSMQNIARGLFTPEEIKNYYRQFFTNLSTMLLPHSVYAREDVIANIKHYMKENFHKNLTQDFISSLFFLNRSYLSTLFKKQTQKKFVDYLNELRIEQAKLLLRKTDRKLYRIAKAVGYDNVKYFFRIFKKITGETPEAYRKKHRQET